MYVLAGFTDANVRLGYHKAVVLRKCIHRGAIIMLNQPSFNGGIGKVELQVARLDILDRPLDDADKLVGR